MQRESAFCGSLLIRRDTEHYRVDGTKMGYWQKKAECIDLHSAYLYFIHLCGQLLPK